MTEIDPVERALRQARAELSAPNAALERVWQRLPALPATAPLTKWAALKATGASGVIAAAALVSGGFGLGYWVRDVARDAPAAPVVVAAPAAQPLPVAVPAPTAVASAPALVAPAPVLATPPSTASPREPVRRAVHDGSAADQSQQELALLARIERALRNDDAALALALLAELEQRFPETLLREEREAVRLMSHCIQKERGAAADARAFLRAHSASVYQSRLRALCALESARNGEALKGSAAPDTDGG